jgi:hypothetical protein
MALDASHTNLGANRGRTWRERLSQFPVEKVVMWLTLAGVLLTIFLLLLAIYQTRVMVLTAQYQSAITVIDQSTQVTDNLFKQPGLGDVLKSTNLDRVAIEKANESLEAYQSLIFKAALLKEKSLLPDDF